MFGNCIHIRWKSSSKRQLAIYLLALKCNNLHNFDLKNIKLSETWYLKLFSAESGAMVSNKNDLDEHYAYIDLKHLQWDALNNYWKPQGTSGDRYGFVSLKCLN